MNSESSIELVESPETDALPSIDTEQDWERFIKAELGGVVKPASFFEIESAGTALTWRGMEAGEILRFLSGRQDRIEIHSELANASPYWRDAIAHGRINSPYPFHAALGFRINKERLTLTKQHLKGMPADIPESALRQEERYVSLNGSLEPEDVEYLIVRFRGDRPGKPKEPLAYRVSVGSAAGRNASENQDETPAVNRAA